MNKQIVLAGAAVGAALGLATAAWAYVDGSGFFDTGSANPGDGLIGTHTYGTAPNSRGYSLDYGTNSSPGWSLGLDTNSGDFYLYNYYYPGVPPKGTTDTYSLRLRGDTGQMELGQNAPHPVSQQQLNITAGTSSKPLTGIGVGTYGGAAGLYLQQLQTAPATLRTQIDFNNVYQMGTDSKGDGTTADWWLTNTADQHLVLGANANDSVSMNYGATITGAATVNGPSSLLGNTTIGASGSLVGFYGATPQGKFTLTGCRSDGTALANLISHLQSMGLLTDQTTP